MRSGLWLVGLALAALANLAAGCGQPTDSDQNRNPPGRWPWFAQHQEEPADDLNFPDVQARWPNPFREPPPFPVWLRGPRVKVGPTEFAWEAENVRGWLRANLRDTCEGAAIQGVDIQLLLAADRYAEFGAVTTVVTAALSFECRYSSLALAARSGVDSFACIPLTFVDDQEPKPEHSYVVGQGDALAWTITQGATVWRLPVGRVLARESTLSDLNGVWQDLGRYMHQGASRGDASVITIVPKAPRIPVLYVVTLVDLARTVRPHASIRIHFPGRGLCASVGGVVETSAAQDRR